LAGLVLVVGLAGCPGIGDREIEDAPLLAPDEIPTFTEHVAPILETHCLACHGEVPQAGAPSYFRLDLCEDTDVLGAQSQSLNIVRRVLESPAAPMPPFGPAPTAGEGDALRRWEEASAPCD
jgi:hypothetical protein